MELTVQDRQLYPGGGGQYPVGNKVGMLSYLKTTAFCIDVLCWHMNQDMG